MSELAATSLAPMVRKLQLWRGLNAEEQQAILNLPHKVEKLPLGGYVVRHGDFAATSCLLMSGFAIRQKVAQQGARSILALHAKGDIVDLQNSLLGRADHSVLALSQITIARIPRESIIDLAFRMPNVGLAMWYDTLVDASISREWLLNNSRRGARERIAHLLCEIGLRLEAMGLGIRTSFALPMTQEHLADATGLTSVHINRSLRRLEAEGLISRSDPRYVEVSDWNALRDAGDFSEDYMHLDARKGTT